MESEHNWFQWLETLDKREAMFTSFTSSSPIESDVPMPVRRARYARELYYVNLRKVFEEYARTFRVLPRAMI